MVGVNWNLPPMQDQSPYRNELTFFCYWLFCIDTWNFVQWFHKWKLFDQIKTMKSYPFWNLDQNVWKLVGTSNETRRIKKISEKSLTILSNIHYEFRKSFFSVSSIHMSYAKIVYDEIFEEYAWE